MFNEGRGVWISGAGNIVYIVQLTLLTASKDVQAFCILNSTFQNGCYLHCALCTLHLAPAIALPFQPGLKLPYPIPAYGY